MLLLWKFAQRYWSLDKEEHEKAIEGILWFIEYCGKSDKNNFQAFSTFNSFLEDCKKIKNI